MLHFTIGANDPVLSRANAKLGRFLQLNAARRINHIRHVAGNTSPGFCTSRRMHATNILDRSIDCNTFCSGRMSWFSEKKSKASLTLLHLAHHTQISHLTGSRVINGIYRNIILLIFFDSIVLNPWLYHMQNCFCNILTRAKRHLVLFLCYYSYRLYTLLAMDENILYFGRKLDIFSAWREFINSMRVKSFFVGNKGEFSSLIRLYGHGHCDSPYCQSRYQ